MAIVEAISTVGTLSALLEKAKKRFGKSIDSQAAEALLKAIELTSSLQSELLSAQRENARLESKILQLQSENRALKSHGLAEDRYQESKIGGAVVLVPKGKTQPYYCPGCRQANHDPAPLQRPPMADELAELGITHLCPRCNSPYSLN